MMRLQQTQTLEFQRQNMEIQKENDERQLQLMKFVEEKQSKMQKELNKQREEERREREEERKEFNEKILEMQTKAKERLELLTQVIANKNSNELNRNVFFQTVIWSALETFHYVPEEDLTFEAYFRRFGDVFRIDCKSGVSRWRFVFYYKNWELQNIKCSWTTSYQNRRANCPSTKGRNLWWNYTVQKPAYFIKDGNVSIWPTKKAKITPHFLQS